MINEQTINQQIDQEYQRLGEDQDRLEHLNRQYARVFYPLIEEEKKLSFEVREETFRRGSSFRNQIAEEFGLIDLRRRIRSITASRDRDTSILVNSIGNRIRRITELRSLRDSMQIQENIPPNENIPTTIFPDELVDDFVIDDLDIEMKKEIPERSTSLSDCTSQEDPITGEPLTEIDVVYFIYISPSGQRSVNCYNKVSLLRWFYQQPQLCIWEDSGRRPVVPIRRVFSLPDGTRLSERSVQVIEDSFTNVFELNALGQRMIGNTRGTHGVSEIHGQLYTIYDISEVI